MARPVRCRRIERLPEHRSFVPEDTEVTETIMMSVDEYEVIRLLDGIGLTQGECAERMAIARTTVTAIYESARHKVADALVNGRRLLIAGGRCEYVPVEAPEGLIKKGSGVMRLAVTYDNGQIFQHFGHTEQFKLYDIENGAIVGEQIVDTNGSGHGALAGFLQSVEAEALICGGIGKGAQTALAEAGITLYGGVQGSADEAAAAYAAGSLQYDPDAKCDHHDHEHHHEHHHGGECGHHGCGEHKCEGN